MNTKQLFFQKIFIEKLKEVAPPSISLVDELIDILEISMDSAYRRIRSETALSIDEVYLLCKHYNISFDSLSDIDLNSVTFKYKSLANNESLLLEYLESIMHNLNQLASLSNSKIIFASRDIPFFYHFKYPELAKFKLYYWMRSIMNVQEMQSVQFEDSTINEQITTVGKNIFEAYIKVPSIEIWTTGVFDSLIKQVEYSWEAGFFKSKETALQTCSLIEEEITYIRQQAENKAKFTEEVRKFENQNNFELYVSDIEIGNNTIQTIAGENKAIFLTHHTFNSLLTTNSAFVAETEIWLNSLMSKSTLISGVSEKFRNMFFKEITQKLKALEQFINNG